MTSEEAIKSLKNIIEYWTHKPTEIKAAELAISALEKQIPKKPKKILQAFEYRFGDCPSCNKSSDMNYKHCQYCGQKLDWE